MAVLIHLASVLEGVLIVADTIEQQTNYLIQILVGNVEVMQFKELRNIVA